MSPAVLIDMSNLVVGGGVQVGASFLDELARLVGDPQALRRWPWLRDVAVEASEAVVANATAPRGSLRVTVVDGRPAARLRRRPRGDEFDVSFTVFGPDYGSRRARTRMVGFADVTSLFPEHAAIHGRRARLRHAVRSRVSCRAFRAADLVVAESAHVTAALEERWGIPRRRLRVVPNVLNRVFTDESLREPLSVQVHHRPAFAFPTRAYPHKNLALLGAAARILREEHGRDVEFLLTLTDDEWQALDPDTRAASRNAGPLRVSQVPSLYAACDGVVFPSLNECFSVTPLEALRAGRPLVASDRPFVREVAGDAAWYFDPIEPASLARALLDVTADDALRATRVADGLRVADGWPTGRDRAAAYLDLVDETLASGATRPG
ncbi:glycosyltransferase [Nocardioides renjunii]|uniref:glycosyltransferase n=1 Tax=Nocardioides renjunii TaxID=3095075 RepID=UPI002B0020FD|nr:glycosyltransferase [Nocardioides sp. S-34]WQQ22152.1 glycosyltransferase [Nocardioides sp. S-34]